MWRETNIPALGRKMSLREKKIKLKGRRTGITKGQWAMGIFLFYRGYLHYSESMKTGKFIVGPKAGFFVPRHI